MECGNCIMCVVEKVYIDELPDGNDYQRIEIEQWQEGDKEKPFCIMQDLYTDVDPKRDCCNADARKYARGKNEKNSGLEEK